MNDKFPGLPDYTGPVSGMFFAVHHSVMCEHSDNILKRVRYIRSDKPIREQSVRLANLMYLGVVGETYQAKLAPLYAELLVYVRTVNPDCAWDESVGGLRFTKGA